MSEIHQAPRAVQLGVVGLYVAVVVAGSVASHTAVGAHNDHYFARKSNVLNQLFVKRGWLWFTLVFWGSYFARRRSPPHTLKRPALYHVVARYAAATLWWLLFAMWFFGPPLMDRVFLLTGGGCEVELPPAEPPRPGGAALPLPTPPMAAQPRTSSLCRRLGGLWGGGHDPSGHVFLLVHSSIALWMEILPTLWAVGPRGWSTRTPLALLALWGVMLFFTSAYFHSFSEKLSGLVFGLAEAVLVYFVGENTSWGWVFGVNARRPPFVMKAASEMPEPETAELEATDAE